MTLIEILVVISLMGILVSVGAASIDRRPLQVREATSVLAADVQRARTEAIRINTPVRIFFDVAADSYRVEADVLCDGVPDRDLDDDGVDDLASAVIFSRDVGSYFPRVNLASTDATGDAIWFDPRGIPRTSGCSNLSAPVTVAFQAKGDAAIARAVRIELQGSVETE